MDSFRLFRIVGAFDRWAALQNEAEAREASSIRAWGPVTILVSIIVLVAAYAPYARNVFGLNPAIAMLAFLPALGNALLFNLLHRNNRPFTRFSWVLHLLGVVFLHFFCAMLVALSNFEGAAVCSALLLFTMGYHGHLFRVHPGAPFVPIASGLAILAAVPWSSSPNHYWLFAIMGTAGLVGMVLLGTAAYRSDLSRKQAEQLRVALSAQELEQKSQEIERLSEMLLEMLGANHDLNNALATALLNVHQLEFAAAGASSGTVPRRDVESATGHIGKSLKRIRDLVQALQERARTSRVVPLQGVELDAVLPPLVKDLQSRHTWVRITLHLDRSFSARPLVRGGSMTLERILENLILNACEGSGSDSAREVDIHVRLHDRTGRIEIRVEDDGPGFSEKQLAKAITRFETTKRNGTGLGLYTCDRLVQASHGSLTRGNREEGGAVVTVFFSMEKQ